jgi:hypothetical protein
VVCAHVLQAVTASLVVSCPAAAAGTAWNDASCNAAPQLATAVELLWFLDLSCTAVHEYMCQTLNVTCTVVCSVSRWLLLPATITRTAAMFCM